MNNFMGHWLSNIRHVINRRRILCVLLILSSGLYNSTYSQEIVEASANIHTDSAPQAEEFSIVGQLGGFIGQVYVDQDIAYIEEGMKLTLLDVSDPTDPVRISATLPVFANISDIQVVNDLAYLTDDSGLHIWDVSDPTGPVFVSSYQSSSQAKFVRVHHSLAYVGSSSGIIILDVSSPTSIAELGVFGALPPMIMDMWVNTDANVAFAITSNSIYAIDISVADNPTLLGSLEDIFPYASAIIVSGTNAYIGSEHGVAIVDCSNPRDLRMIGQFADTIPIRAIAIVHTQVYLATYKGLFVYDVSNPALPVELDMVYTSNTAQDIVVMNSMAYIGNTSALQVIDIANPSESTVVGLYQFIVDARNVFVIDDIAYVTDWGDLYIIRLPEGAENPIELGHYAGTAYIDDIYVTGRTAYLLQSSKLVILGLTDLSNPTEISSYRIDSARNLFVHGDKVYITGDMEALRIIDVKDLSSPNLIGMTEILDADSQGIFVQDHIAYVTYASYQAQDNGLRIFDVSSPATPTELVFYPLDSAGDVFVIDGIAYIQGDNIHAIDVTNPTNPVQLGSYQIPLIAQTIFMIGHVVYIPNCQSSVFYGWGCFISVVDFTDPTQPSLLVRQNFPGYENEIFMSGRNGYLTSDSQGFFTVQYEGTVDPRPVVQFDNQLYSVNEQEHSISITLKLDRAPTKTATLDYTTGGGNAIAGVDYQPTSGTLSFAPGEIRKAITVPILDDAIPEDNESFHLLLSNPKNTILNLPFSAALTIVDNDPIVTATPTRTNTPILFHTPTSTATLTATPTNTSTSTTTPVQTPSQQVTPTFTPTPTAGAEQGEKQLSRIYMPLIVK